MSRLPGQYVALLAKRYVIQSADLGIVGLDQPRVIYPDVHVAQTRESAMLHDGPAATLLAEPSAELMSPLPEEVPLLSVEIRDVAQRRLVTLIEILSPANKQDRGAREYDQRRLELLRTRTHLLEIDLLRSGERIVLQGQLPPAAYYVFLSRTDRRPRTPIWPIALCDALPTVPVPLLRPDPDVPLELQTTVRACFELVGYERLLDYSGPPPAPSLGVAENNWLVERLKQAGLRSAVEA